MQVALQRRTITWQLFGYLLGFKFYLVRTGPLVAIYNKVEKRESELRHSYQQGTEAFKKQVEQQRAANDEVRQQIEAAVLEGLAAQEKVELNELHRVLVQELVSSLASQRRDLLDSKTFISDKDAAILGRAFATNVVQLRLSLQSLLGAMEAITKVVATQRGGDGGKLVARLVDQIVISGEDFLIAMIRLERGVDRQSNHSILRLTWDVLRGR